MYQEVNTMAAMRVRNIVETDIRDLNITLDNNREALVIDIITFYGLRKIIRTSIKGYGIRIELNGELGTYLGSNCTVINGSIHKVNSFGSIRNQGKIGKPSSEVILDSSIDTNKYYKGAHSVEIEASKYHRTVVVHINGKLNYLENSQNILTTINGSVENVLFKGDLYTKGIIVEANSNKIYSTKE